MLKKYMHNRERHFALLNDNRVVRPFEWGTEYITDQPDGRDPRELFSEYARHTIQNSDKFFVLTEIQDFNLGSEGPGVAPEFSKDATRIFQGKREVLTWTSSITTQSPENNTAVATWFPHATNRRAAVVVLPH